MSNRWSRYEPNPVSPVHPGWRTDDLTDASHLVGANGMTIGSDGRLYVAQILGAQVTALDVETGGRNAFSAPGDGIDGPDDCVFMRDGTFIVTETILGRVTARSPDGTTRVICDELPAANGIATDHRAERLFVDECRPGGRLVELDPSGTASPVVLLEDLDSPNALAMGPDGRLYLPAMEGNQIWVYDLDRKRGAALYSDIAAPTAVKFDSRGRLVTTESANGQITAFDLESGRRSVIATVPVGIDNLSFTSDDRLFVSHFTDGRVAEELPNGNRRILSEPGLVGPYGLGIGADGVVLIADAAAVKTLNPATGQVSTLRSALANLHVFAVGICEFLDGTAVLGRLPGDLIIYPSGSDVPRVLASGLETPAAMVVNADRRSLLVAESGASRVTEIDATGQRRVLAESLGRTGGVAVGADGRVYIGHDSVVDVLDQSGRLIDSFGGFSSPEGIAVSGDVLLVADVGARELIALALPSGDRQIVVSNAPIGPPRRAAMYAAFCPVTADAHGAFYVGCNGDGVIRRYQRRD